MDQKSPYVTPPRPTPASQDRQRAVLEQIKKALVTSRLTLAGQNAGGNPYDAGGARQGAIWTNRSRF